MASVEPPPFDRDQTVVRPHAVERARERAPEVFHGREVEVKAEIVRRVEQAIISKMVYDARPKRWRGYGERGDRVSLPFWQRLLVSGDLAFVVDISRAPKLEVITTLAALRPEGAPKYRIR